MNTAQVPYALLADLVVLLHVAFVVFAVMGGLLAVRWQGFIWVHLPGWVCPLTPLENWLRRRGGMGSYSSDFITHYILPALYPEGLTREVQIVLGAFVVLINLLIYGWVFRSRAKSTNF